MTFDRSDALRTGWHCGKRRTRLRAGRRRVFSLLEQDRLESLVGDDFAGVQHNLRHRHETWVDVFTKEGILATEQGNIVFAVALSCRSYVTGIQIDDVQQNQIESVRISLAPYVGAEMAALRSLRHDQGGLWRDGGVDRDACRLHLAKVRSRNSEDR
ncbi:hypothetical protein HNE04_27425 [Caenimonas sp. S4]|nr:hypothetical protein [Caenimonas soli]